MFRDRKLGDRENGKKSKRNAMEWKYLNPGQLRFNVDGATRGSLDDTRIWGVLRGYRVRIKMQFSKSTGWGDASMTKLLAIKEAMLHFAASMWVRSHELLIASDSTNAVNRNLAPEEAPWKLRNIILQMGSLKSSIDRWKIVYP